MTHRNHDGAVFGALDADHKKLMSLTGLMRDGRQLFLADGEMSGDNLKLATQRIRNARATDQR